MITFTEEPFGTAKCKPKRGATKCKPKRGKETSPEFTEARNQRMQLDFERVEARVSADAIKYGWNGTYRRSKWITCVLIVMMAHGAAVRDEGLTVVSRWYLDYLGTLSDEV